MLTRRDLIAGATLVALCGQHASAQTVDDALLAAARKEGSVVWCATLIVNQAILPIKAAFQKKNPGVTLHYVRNDEAPTAIRLMNEAKGEQSQADMFDGRSIMETLRRARVVASYTSPTAGSHPAVMRDRDGSWTAILLSVFASGVNTSVVPASARPKSDDDLLDPQWRGKMAWNPSSIAGEIRFVGATLLSRGEADGARRLQIFTGADVFQQPHGDQRPQGRAVGLVGADLHGVRRGVSPEGRAASQRSALAHQSSHFT